MNVPARTDRPSGGMMPEVRTTFLKLFVLVMLTGLSAPALSAGAPEQIAAEHVQFFEKHVRPLLVDKCFQCHSERSSKGGLRVDSGGYLLQGGESGPAIVPGNPGESLLVQAIRYESYEMPPSGKLNDDQIAILTRWVEIGAPWPGDDGKVVKRTARGEFSEEDRQWWAFQPVQDPVPPTVAEYADWCRNPIDQFIASRQTAEQLTPAPEADRRTLIRRLYFDLLGLPPTAEEVQVFEQNPDPQAYEHLVDNLLARPEYGERWARHWLDLVRFAESDGYRADNYRPEAWRYRDYVIKSLNEDKPYDRFVQEQLAGDELFPNDPDALVATGFLRHGILEYNVPDAHGHWDNLLNEVTDVTSDVFLGLGFQCARCHDHKFDPLLQKDYFQLRAFFAPMLPHDDLPAATSAEHARFVEKNAIYLEKTKAVREKLDAALQEPLERVFEATIKRYPDDIQVVIRKPDEARTPAEKQLMQFVMHLVHYEQARVDSRLTPTEKDQVLALRRELAAFDSLKPAQLPCPMTVRDVGPVAPAMIIPKQNVEVQPGFPSILESKLPQISSPKDNPTTTGRRSTLAGWLTRPNNPLTPRVMTNRIWQYHFGKGVAANSSDFGRLGEAPSDPQLLDWLTSRFVEGGWRLKGLHRLILTSATYRQSASHPQLAEFLQRDPTNRWYWRADVRRLDAEQIRDAIFAATGELESTRGGAGVQPDRPRRSIYTRIMRNSRDPLLDAFDLPFFMSSNSNRDKTTSPVQSLLLINSQVMLKHAERLADRVVRLSTGSANDPTLKLQFLWWNTFGRPPTEEELSDAQGFLREQTSRRLSSTQDTAPLAKVTTGKVPYRDGQAILFQDQTEQEQLLVAPEQSFNMGDFTLEVYFQLRSVYSGGDIRTLVAKSGLKEPRTGWMFGITGKASRRKPQTLVLQLFGNGPEGNQQEAVLFSDHHLELNKPYYASVAVKLARPDAPGSATFHVKDLSNDEEPLMTAVVPLSLTSIATNHAQLSFGSREQRDWRFDGLLDDIRISGTNLAPEQLLISSEGVAASTLGYWRFETNPGILQNSLPDGPTITTRQQNQQASPQDAAFADLCHVLLNSNEFLYVY